MPRGTDKQPINLSDLLPDSQADFVTTSSLGRPELLDALKTEIAAQDAQLKKPGHTTWTLLGTVAAITWLLLNQLDPNTTAPKPDFIYAVSVCLLFSLLVETWDPLRNLLELKVERPRGPLRFLAWRIVGTQRILILGHIIRYAVLLFFSLQLRSVPWLGLILIVYMAFNLLSMILALVSTYFDAWVPLNVFRKLSFSALFFAFLNMTIVGLTLYFLCNLNPVNFPSIRIGLTLGIWLLLLVILCDGISPPPILEMLREILRDLSFGRITVEDAARQSDIAMAGLRMNDLLQKELRPMIEVLEKLNTGLREASIKVAMAKKQAEEGTMTKDEVNNTKSALESAAVYFNQNIGFIKAIEEMSEKFLSKMRPASFLDAKVKADLEAIMERIRKAYKESAQDNAGIEVNIKTLTGDLDKKANPTGNSEK